MTFRLGKHDGSHSSGFSALEGIHRASTSYFSPFCTEDSKRTNFDMSSSLSNTRYANLRRGVCAWCSTQTQSVEKRVAFLLQAKGDLLRPSRLLYLSPFLSTQSIFEDSDQTERHLGCSFTGSIACEMQELEFHVCISLADMESGGWTLASEEAVA